MKASFRKAVEKAKREFDSHKDEVETMAKEIEEEGGPETIVAKGNGHAD